MNRQKNIILHLESLDRLIERYPPSPLLKGRLKETAERFIVDSKSVRCLGLSLLFCLVNFLGTANLGAQTAATAPVQPSPSPSVQETGKTKAEKRDGKRTGDAGDA